MSFRIGLVGYGVGGRLFHAPYIVAAEGCELAGVVTRDPERAREVAEDLGDHIPLVSTLAELIALGVDGVAISTPPRTRRQLVLEAVAAGVHVLADKPFAPDAEAGMELVVAADRAGVLLNVFHNRRWDPDIVTAAAVLDSGELGEISRLDLRCDQDDPSDVDAGAGGGLLLDLGSHVVDQALLLLGPARYVTGHLDWIETPDGRADAGFAIGLEHASGAYSQLSSTKRGRLDSRELRLFGDRGSYVSNYSDVQVEAIRAGRRPARERDGWGLEAAERWGRLSTIDGTRSVPSLQGSYASLYEEFARAAPSGGRGPVPAVDAVATLRVLDAVRESATKHVIVELDRALTGQSVKG
jgi:predicted dehydrogenase